MADAAILDLRNEPFHQFWRMRGVVPAVSMYAIEEVRRNLYTEAERERFEAMLAKTSIVSDADPRILPIGIDLPGKDRPILAAAIAAGVDFLITGDKNHFGKFDGLRISDVGVVSPGKFLTRRTRSPHPA